MKTQKTSVPLIGIHGHRFGTTIDVIPAGIKPSKHFEDYEPNREDEWLDWSPMPEPYASAPALLAENARLREWLEQLKQTATAVLSYSKESPEPLAAVLAVDAKVREVKLREALKTLHEAGEAHMQSHPSEGADFHKANADFYKALDTARAALQGGGL